jgi:hypothetical protein
MAQYAESSKVVVWLGGNCRHRDTDKSQDVEFSEGDNRQRAGIELILQLGVIGKVTRLSRPYRDAVRHRTRLGTLKHGA